MPESPIPSFDEIHARSEKPQRRFYGSLGALLPHFSSAERLLLYILALVLAVSAFVLLAQVNETVSSEVPTPGGSLTEGAVGTPRFINPILDVSQTDADLTKLVFSGLVRATADGGYIPDLAESYDVSADGTVYTFHLRPNATFHDGSSLTAADVLFTIQLAQNPETKSPRRADWDGVQIGTPDERTVVFTLPHAYAPFLENATLGILPKAIWQNVSAEEFPFSALNTHPIGSGPYMIADVSFDATGAPREYALGSFKKFALGVPNITRIVYTTYANEDELAAAYANGDIESFISSSPKTLPQDIQNDPALKKAALARVFGVFFNQNHAAVLTDTAARKALRAAVDPESLVKNILGGYGVALNGPLPPGLLGGDASSTALENTDERGIEKAREILTNGGWKFTSTASSTLETTAAQGSWTKNKQTLSLTLATADTDELVASANAIAAAWQALGVPTKVDVYPLTEFNQSVLRPRAYDAVFFGEVVGRSLDLFAFWHSSQRNDPGLNLALYASSAADKSLADARSETDPEKHVADIREFLQTLDNDAPAVFLYSPSVAYIVPERIKGIELGTLGTPADRFDGVYTWYRDTERVWNFFTK